MTRAKLQAAIAGGSADELEQSFYEALRNADIGQLMACWAEEDDIVCVHPGGPRLIGPTAIRMAFEALFAHGTVQAYPERVHKVVSMACAVHHLIERVELNVAHGPNQAYVIATNVYQKTPQGWRMVAHHASPGTALDGADIGVRPVVLH